MDWAHAIVMGLLCGGAYWTVDHLGWLENRTKVQKFLVMFPVIFVIALLVNLIWPSG